MYIIMKVTTFYFSDMIITRSIPGNADFSFTAEAIFAD